MASPHIARMVDYGAVIVSLCFVPSHLQTGQWDNLIWFWPLSISYCSVSLSSSYHGPMSGLWHINRAKRGVSESESVIWDPMVKYNVLK